MKKLICYALTLFTVFIISCEKENGNGNEENTSFLVPEFYPTIQAAIDASSNGDTIFVKPGIYKENINFIGKEIVVHSFDPDDPEIIKTTIIDGDKNGTVVTFNNSETELAVLNGFTIINGDAGTSKGGGIFISNNSNPRILNNIISNNTAQYGAGICVSGESQADIENNIFYGNISKRSRGAGIYVIDKSSVIIDNNIFKDHESVDGTIHIGSTYTDESYAAISNNTIENNTTESGTGGIKVTAVSRADISDNIISDNTGGGDYSAAGITISKNSQANISDNIIENNIAGKRGAILIHDESEASITGNSITGNSAGRIEDTRYGSGGGISVTRSSTAEISDNTISGNSAWNKNHGGGGIIISYSSTAIINNNEILNNNAYRFGGGIYVRFDSNYITITNNLISGNKADGYGASNGGGVYLNSIVEAIVHSNTISKNWAQRFGGGIYFYNNVEILKAAGGVEWIRNNFPSVDEPHNDYDENTHGDDTYGGAHVFFSD